MRILHACFAAAALVAAAGGCLGDGGTVQLTFDSQMSVTPAISKLNASNGTANTTPDGYVHFTATSGDGTLTMLAVGPAFKAGDTIDLTVEHNFVSFDIQGAGWSNNGGMIAVDGVNPYRLRFEGVPMIKGSGSAMGSFVINGTATFK
jgi:hypothetical protein